MVQNEVAGMLKAVSIPKTSGDSNVLKQGNHIMRGGKDQKEGQGKSRDDAYSGGEYVLVGQSE